MNPLFAMRDPQTFLATDPRIIVEAVTVTIREFEKSAATLQRTRPRNPNHAAFLNREIHGYRSAAEQGRKFLSYISKHVTPSLTEVNT